MGFFFKLVIKQELVVMVHKHYIRNMTIKCTYGKNRAGGTQLRVTEYFEGEVQSLLNTQFFE